MANFNILSWGSISIFSLGDQFQHSLVGIQLKKKQVNDKQLSTINLLVLSLQLTEGTLPLLNFNLAKYAFVLANDSTIKLSCWMNENKTSLLQT